MYQMTEKEQAFWSWWENLHRTEQEMINVRMAFDFGYDAGRNSL